MDFYKRAEELKNMLKMLASMRDDDRLLDYIEMIDLEEMNDFSLFVYIGSLTQYFSQLKFFSEEEISALQLYDSSLVSIDVWRRIKYNWAD